MAGNICPIFIWEFIEMGVRHFCIGWDLMVIYQWCRKHGEGLHRLLGE